MAIFALITDLTIINPPEWYDSFTQKYLSRPKPHITLIQPRYMESKEAISLLYLLKKDKVLSNYNFPVHIEASGITEFYDRTGCMISVRHPELYDVQKYLRDRLSQYKSFVFPQNAIYEEEYSPHLTLADSVPEGALDSLLQIYSMGTLRLSVVISHIIATIPPDFSIEESRKEENYHIVI